MRHPLIALALLTALPCCGTSASSGAAPAASSRAPAATPAAPGAVASLAGAAAGSADTMQLGDAVAIDADPDAGGGTPLAGDAGGGDPSVMPANAYCAPVSGWSADWVTYEDAVLSLTNQARAQGANCGGQVFGPAAPLVADAALRCAARVHSMDMAVNGYFAHNDQQGKPPWDRIAAAGATVNRGEAENILAGRLDPTDVVQGWLHSPGHCVNMMSPKYTRLGVGLFYGTYGMKSYWTQDFSG